MGNAYSLVHAIPFLIVGFIFNTAYLRTRFISAAAEGQRLFFLAASSGFLFGAGGWWLRSLIIDQRSLEWLERFPGEIGDELFFSVLLACSVYLILTAALRTSFWLRPKLIALRAKLISTPNHVLKSILERIDRFLARLLSWLRNKRPLGLFWRRERRGMSLLINLRRALWGYYFANHSRANSGADGKAPEYEKNRNLDYHKALAARPLTEQVYWDWIERNGTPIQKIIAEAVYRRKSVFVCLRSRKIYCGLIYRMPPARLDWGAQYIEIIPAFSAARTPNTLSVVNRLNYYSFAVWQYRARIERLATAYGAPDDAVRKLLGEPKSKKSILDELVSRTEQLAKDESESDGYAKRLSIKDWAKVIAVNDIETISLFETRVPGNWFLKEAKQ